MRKTFIALILLFLLVGIGSIHAHEDKNDSTSMTSDPAMLRSMADHQQMEAVNAFPDYHPLVFFKINKS